MARLRDFYKSDVAPAMMKKFGYKSVMQIPKLEKVVINVGAGEARDNSKVIDAIITDLTAITGQKPVVCKAKKSVANFKLREGMNTVSYTHLSVMRWEKTTRPFLRNSEFLWQEGHTMHETAAVSYTHLKAARTPAHTTQMYLTHSMCQFTPYLLYQ